MKPEFDTLQEEDRPMPGSFPVADFMQTGAVRPPDSPGREDPDGSQRLLESGDVILSALQRGTEFLAARQRTDGSWSGEYGGPMFLLPLYVAGAHVCGMAIPLERREGMIAYFRSVQNSDGSIGLHSEGPGSMFCTALSYVALRILGVSAEDPDVAPMRDWIHANGSPLGSASWGKSILALLNLYGYEGVQPVPPELLLLPRWLPFHPGRLWCHVRAVYLPLSYLYAGKHACPVCPLIRSLREELYGMPYDRIRFSAHRRTLASCDAHVRPTRLLHLANALLRICSSAAVAPLRELALTRVLEHIRYEDRATGFVNLGPVNAVLNTVVYHFENPVGTECRKHFGALDGYLQETSAGLLMNGEDSTALWDTAFAVQAIAATPFAALYGDALQRAFQFLADTQILADLPDPERYFRHPPRGAWPFSKRLQGWAVTDCTSEAFKSCVLAETLTGVPVEEERLVDGIRWILSTQNRDDGWAAYEKQRGPRWLERFNPSHVFADIMVEYSYTECTSACVQALAVARARLRHRFGRELDTAIRRGSRFLRRQQRADGSWEGSWGVCFTIGTWYGIQGLLAAGVARNDPQIRRAVDFLHKHQSPDGGWGEKFQSCLHRRYVAARPSRAVNTAWGLLALAGAGDARSGAAARAARFLAELQQPDGDWPREPMTGVFNKTTLIHYDNYRRYFPVRALAEYLRCRAEPSGPAG